jgi:hypothetical protein
MARVVHLVCDKCDQREGVATYTIGSPAGRVRLDLCPKHAKPLIELAGAATVSGKQGRKVHDLDADGNPIL